LNQSQKAQNNYNHLNLEYFLIYFKIYFYIRSPPCPEDLPGRLARQTCTANLPGKLARQTCPANLPGKLARQTCLADLPGRLDSNIIFNEN
jgi:hypothetical protein